MGVVMGGVMGGVGVNRPVDRPVRVKKNRRRRAKKRHQDQHRDDRNILGKQDRKGRSSTARPHQPLFTQRLQHDRGGREGKDHTDSQSG